MKFEFGMYLEKDVQAVTYLSSGSELWIRVWVFVFAVEMQGCLKDSGFRAWAGYKGQPDGSRVQGLGFRDEGV